MEEVWNLSLNMFVISAGSDKKGEMQERGKEESEA